MTDYPFQIAVLIQKSIVGVLTDEEREQLERWMAESDEHERMYREFVRPGFLEEARRLHIICTTLDGLSKIKENE